MELFRKALCDCVLLFFTENRSAFQKIYDEIKYLCRVATAGSKQARELEKIKKTFAEVYRLDAKNTVVEDGVGYSLGDMNYPRKMMDYKDTMGRRTAEDETVNELVQRGKITTIEIASIPAELSNVNWESKTES